MPQHPNYQRLCALADEHGWRMGLKVTGMREATITLRRASARIEATGSLARIDVVAGRLIPKLAKGLV